MVGVWLGVAGWAGFALFQQAGFDFIGSVVVRFELGRDKLGWVGFGGGGGAWCDAVRYKLGLVRRGLYICVLRIVCFETVVTVATRQVVSESECVFLHIQLFFFILS